jgi:hypothetical protein
MLAAIYDRRPRRDAPLLLPVTPGEALLGADISLAMPISIRMTGRSEAQRR